MRGVNAFLYITSQRPHISYCTIKNYYIFSVRSLLGPIVLKFLHSLPLSLKLSTEFTNSPLLDRLVMMKAFYVIHNDIAISAAVAQPNTDGDSGLIVEISTSSQEPANMSVGLLGTFLHVDIPDIDITTVSVS